MSEPTQIDRTSVMNDVIRRYPAAIGVFNYFGIDACCGGATTISEAAENNFVDGEDLVDALRSAARYETAVRAMRWYDGLRVTAEASEPPAGNDRTRYS